MGNGPMAQRNQSSTILTNNHSKIEEFCLLKKIFIPNQIPIVENKVKIVMRRKFQRLKHVLFHFKKTSR
jgi:hypothetical protein